MAVRIAYIGDGGIAKAAQATLGTGYTTCAILVRAGHPCDGDNIVYDLKQLLARQPHVVVECAGHDAVRAFAEPVLRAGVPFVIVSIGVLADRALEERLEAAAQLGQARLILPAGAVGGIDALAAARLGGLTRVRYCGRKPAGAWKGSPAEQRIPLDKLTEATTIFSGSAREAALAYPKNSNVAATIALAGLGFDRTEVELVADPIGTGNVHLIEFEGTDGTFRFEINGNPSPDNPKTSLLTAHSVARTLIAFAEAHAAA